MKSWTELCQMNVDHYNNHPVAHTAIPLVGLAATFVAANVILRKLAENDMKNKSGQMAKF